MEQNSVDDIIADGSLQIICKSLDICNTYSKEELSQYIRGCYTKLEDLKEKEKFLVQGNFREAEEIVFIYSPTEEERNASTFIPKHKEKLSVYGDNDDGTVVTKWRPIKNIGYFNIGLKIRPKDKKKKYFVIPLYLKEVLAKTDRGNTNSDNFNCIINKLEKTGLEIYNRHSPSVISQNVDKNISTNVLEELNITMQGVKRLKKILYNISRNPNQEFVDEAIMERFSEVDNIDPETIHDIMMQSCNYIKIPNGSAMTGLQELFIDNSGDSYAPEDVFIDRPLNTFNTPLNQLLKKRISQLLSRIDVIRTKFERRRRGKGLGKEDIEEIDKHIDECNNIYGDVSKMKMYPFLNDVREGGDISPSVFQRETNYILFDRIYKKLAKRPIFIDTSDYLSIPIDDTWLLYEKLVVVETFNILDSLPGWHSDPHMLEPNKFGFCLKLKTGAKRSLVDISRSDNGKNIEISLYYQRGRHTYFYKKDGKRYAILRPDITIEIKIDKKIYKILTLDAKYMSILESEDQNDLDNPIRVLYMYKDGITVEDPVTGDHIQVCKCAYIVYLGDTSISYLSERTKTGAIGGIGLFPKDGDICTKDLKDAILNFINANIEI